MHNNKHKTPKTAWRRLLAATALISTSWLISPAQAQEESSFGYADAANLFIDSYGATRDASDVGDFAVGLAPVILEGILARYGISNSVVSLLFPTATEPPIDYERIGSIVEEKLRSQSEREAIAKTKVNLQTYHLRVADIAQQWQGANIENRGRLANSLENIYNIISTEVMADALTKAMCNFDPVIDDAGNPNLAVWQRCTVSTTDTHAGYRLWGSAMNLRLMVSAMMAEASEQGVLTGHSWSTVERDAKRAWQINWGYRDRRVLTRYLGCSQHSAVYDWYASASDTHNPMLTEQYGNDSTCRSMLPIVTNLVIENAAAAGNQACVCENYVRQGGPGENRVVCDEAALRDQRPNTSHYFPYLRVTTSFPTDAVAACQVRADEWLSNMAAYSNEIEAHFELSQSLSNAWLQIEQNARTRATQAVANAEAAAVRATQAAVAMPRASEGYIGPRLKKYWFFNRATEAVNLMPHDKNGAPQAAHRIWISSEQVFEIEGSTVPFHVNEWWGVYKGNTFVCNFKPVDTINEDEYHGPFIESLERRQDCNLERW